MRRKVVWFSMGTTFAVVIAGLLIYGSIAGRQPVSAPTPTPTLADAEPTRSAVPPRQRKGRDSRSAARQQDRRAET